jgi:protein O-GlcNAc transferase
MPPTTLQQAFELAMQHHRAGKLYEAEQLYRQILAQYPSHFAAMHFLGMIAHHAGQLDSAVDLIRRAITLHADFPDAFNSLGNVLKDVGQLDEAIAAYRQATVLNPNYPEAFNNLGNALKDKGQPEESIAACRQAIALRPGFAEAHSNLGNALIDNKQLDEAIAAYRQAIALKPDYAEAHSNLGSALKEKGQLDDAIAACRQAIRLRAGYAKAHNNLGNALKDKGQLDEAILAYRQAIAFNPGYAEAYSNLGNVLRDKEELDASVAACQQAIALNPNFAAAYSNLGNVLRDMGQADEAIAACEKALALNPNLPEAHNNLGNSLQDKGQLDEGIARYRQAIALWPEYAESHSNLVFALHYHPGYDPQAITEEHRAWSRQHAEPLRQFIRPHENYREANRTLRVGYVSADFRDHAVSRFLLPLFRHHDHEANQIICYSDVQNEDAVTDGLRACTDDWRRIVGMSDEGVAKMIRDDQIDILVDLAGHTMGNRLRVFARRPAPVQVAYLGYPGTTGLPEIDYRLSDPFADPPGQTEFLHSEKLWRLPVCNWCYDEPEEAPEVRSSRMDGPICFGSFNKLAKASPAVMELWVAILKAAPDSRLMIKSRGLGTQGIRPQISRFFESRGILPERLEIRGGDPDVQSHLGFYNKLDIALDTYPYHGTTTTCEALWMGVPVVSLEGPSHVSRVGVSLLNAVGLPELIAQSAEEYVSIAVALAADLPRLTELRRTLRRRMRASPLMDAPKFARDVEAAYRGMWRAWCETTSTAS